MTYAGARLAVFRITGMAAVVAIGYIHRNGGGLEKVVMMFGNPTIFSGFL